jgi:hypothetical protein
MRRTAQALMALGLLFALAPVGRAAEKDAAAIIDKAVKAHFPKGLDTKNTGLRTKSKGTLHVMGLDLDFTQEVAVQTPNKFKEVMDLTVMDKAVKVVSVYNGKDAWILADGKEVKVSEEILAEFKEAAYAMNLMQGTFLKDKSIKFSLVGEVKVKDKPAVAVTVSRDGSKDITLSFDKETGLIVKVEMRKRDLMSGEEVNEERFITSYQEVGGRKVAKTVEVTRDGKALLELEVKEVQVVEKLDASEFAQPKE